MDYGMIRVWDLARIALEFPVKKAVRRTVSVLLASSALPGAFPPVLIDGLLYVDGGASMQVVSGIAKRGWAYVPDKQRFPFANNGPPIRIRVWIIINQKLLLDPKVVESRWSSIATRSLSTIVRSSTLQSIQDMETYLRLLDLRPNIDAKMRYVAIPQDYEIPNADEMFDAKVMRQLADLGRRMGADPTSWRTEALPPGAPFELE
jgi:hypothetical protein